MNKRPLQIAVGIGALVPILAGLMGVIMGPGIVESSAVTVSLDSHYRYLSALLMGIGFAFCSTISSIERKTSRFQLLTAIVVLGGMGRLYSLITIGVPSHGMLFGLGMELVIVPLLALWQNSVARRSAN